MSPYTPLYGIPRLLTGIMGWGGPWNALVTRGNEKGIRGTSRRPRWDTVKGRHLPLRGGQDIPQEDGIPHTEDLLLVRGEGHSMHRL